MKNFLLLFIFLVTASFIYCYPFRLEAHYCLTKHLLDAIKLNQTRLPLYQKATNNLSTTPISLGLITMEVTMLPALLYLDLKAQKFHKKGIPLFCHEIVSMQKTPPFLASIATNHLVENDDTQRNKNLINLNTYHYFKEEILAQLKEKNNFDRIFWHKLETTLKKEIDDVNTRGGEQYNCLYRHMLESMVRTAHFATSYEILNLSDAEQREMGKLSYRFFKLHLYAFGLSHYFDTLAYPIQQRGTPIICNDVPPLLSDLSSSYLP